MLFIVCSDSNENWDGPIQWVFPIGAITLIKDAQLVQGGGDFQWTELYILSGTLVYIFDGTLYYKWQL